MWAVIALVVNLLNHYGYSMFTSLLTDGHPFEAKLLNIFTILVWMETSFLPYVVLFYLLDRRNESYLQNDAFKNINFCNPHIGSSLA